MTEPKTITIRNFYPYTFVVDPDADTGERQTIALRISRFTRDQGKDFSIRWAANLDRPSIRAIYRKSDTDEQARTDAGAFVVDDAEIRRRRLAEMSPDDCERFIVEEHADAKAEYDFLIELVTSYISVAPGQRVRFEPPDGDPFVLSTGADLVRAFGGHKPQLLQLATAVWAENTLSGAARAAWRTLFAVRAPEPAAAGGAEATRSSPRPSRRPRSRAGSQVTP